MAENSLLNSKKTKEKKRIFYDQRKKVEIS